MSTSPEPENRSRPRETGERRRSRERALELCYEAEAKGITPLELLADLPVRPEEYAVRIVSGVSRHQGEIDALVSAHASGWALDRMPGVDRALLRVGAYELSHEPEVPTAVVIDEAVELAKEYSTEDSGRFVNGVLAALAAATRGDVERTP